MAAILADGIFNCIYLNEKDRIAIQISLKYIPRSPIDNKAALVQVMAWRRIGDKPLSEPMLTRFSDANMRLKGEMSLTYHRWVYHVHTALLRFVLFFIALSALGEFLWYLPLFFKVAALPLLQWGNPDG